MTLNLPGQPFCEKLGLHAKTEWTFTGQADRPIASLSIAASSLSVAQM